jgi:hypothetical protein
VISQVTDKEDFLQGVVFYCKEGIIVGIVLWKGQISVIVYIYNHYEIHWIGGVMVNVPTSSVLDRGFEPRSGQTKDYKIGIGKNMVGSKSG